MHRQQGKSLLSCFCMTARQREARYRLFKTSTPTLGLQPAKWSRLVAATVGARAGTDAAHTPITVCSIGGVRSVTEPRPIGAGLSHEAAVMDLNPPCPPIHVFFIDQQVGEEEFDEKWSPRLQGLISRAAAALRVDMPPDQGPAPSCFDDEMGGFQPLDMGLTSSCRVLEPHQQGRHTPVTVCVTNQIDAVTCLAPEVLRYLQELLEAGKSPSTLRDVKAAIKASRVGEAKLSVDDSVLLSQFLKGAQKLVHRSSRPASPTWDLGRVLSALEQGPFEPLESVSLQWMSLKVAFLLAITSAKRVGDLQALPVHKSRCRLPDNMGVVLRQYPVFLPKVFTDFHLNQSMELHSLRPSQEAGKGQEESTLCPFRAPKIHIQHTAAFRKTDQLFICFGPQCLGEPVSKARLSHWVMEAIQQAYRETGKPVPVGVKVHSTRGVAPPSQEVCVSAMWSTPTTFTWFYCLNVAASTSFGERVLRATSK